MNISSHFQIVNSPKAEAVWSACHIPARGAVAFRTGRSRCALLPSTKQGLLQDPQIPPQAAGNDTRVGVTKKADNCEC